MTDIERTEESAAEVLREVASDLRDHPDLAEAKVVFTDDLLIDVLGIAWRYQFDPDHRTDAQRAVTESVMDAVDEADLETT
jgi:hypothetical protein